MVYAVESRAESRFAPSQWEAALHCSDISHWLGTSPESAPNSYSPCTHNNTSWIQIQIQIQIQKFIGTTMWNMSYQYTQIQQEHTHTNAKRRKNNKQNNCTGNSNIRVIIRWNYSIHEQCILPLVLGQLPIPISVYVYMYTYAYNIYPHRLAYNNACLPPTWVPGITGSTKYPISCISHATSKPSF